MNIYTSKELRGLLGANSEGEGANQAQVEADIQVKDTVAERVKGIKKRSRDKKKVSKGKNVKWREDLIEERIIISEEEKENVENNNITKMSREEEGVSSETQKATAVVESSVTGLGRNSEVEDTRNEELKRKLAEIKIGTTNIYLRRGKEAMKKKGGCRRNRGSTRRRGGLPSHSGGVRTSGGHITKHK